jgi:hypothetical protein
VNWALASIQSQQPKKIKPQQARGLTRATRRVFPFSTENKKL